MSDQHDQQNTQTGSQQYSEPATRPDSLYDRSWRLLNANSHVKARSSASRFSGGDGYYSNMANER